MNNGWVCRQLNSAYWHRPSLSLLRTSTITITTSYINELLSAGLNTWSVVQLKDITEISKTDNAYLRYRYINILKNLNIVLRYTFVQISAFNEKHNG